MSKTIIRDSCVVQVNDGIIGPVEPRKKSVIPRKIDDFPGVPNAYLEVARNYSSTLLMGPPICDELVALIQHMFSEEEASLVRHIRPLKKRTPGELARAEHRSIEEVCEILEHLANEKHILMSSGPEDNRRYMIMPMAGGTFEFVQMGTSVGTSKDTLFDWRRRFAELYEELFKTGYGVDYARHSPSLLRSLPIGQSIESNPMALPSDKLEEVLDRYQTFAVGRCGCRMTKRHLGEDCGRPLETCTGMGDSVESAISKGWMRRADKEEILEIKAQAEASGLVNWVINVDEKSGRLFNVMCSCCGCCCDVFRSITEFNTPGLIAPPHFMPAFDQGRCIYCGLCAKKCQLGAITVDTKRKTRAHQPQRCIGCGQCVVVCEENRAIRMEPTLRYKRPAKSYPMMGLTLFPNLLRLAWNLRKDRR